MVLFIGASSRRSHHGTRYLGQMISTGGTTTATATTTPAVLLLLLLFVSPCLSLTTTTTTTTTTTLCYRRGSSTGSSRGRSPFVRGDRWTRGGGAVLSSSASSSSEKMDWTKTTTKTTKKGGGGARVVSDRSTMTLLEHVNINTPHQREVALPLYFDLLRCGMDPRKASNLLPGASKKTLWANCGSSQFHLPYGSVGQVIPGRVGLRYDNLAGLRDRLRRALESDPDVGRYLRPSECRVVDDAEDKRGYVKIADVYGNVFICREGGNPLRRTHPTWKQPCIAVDNEGDVSKFGQDIVNRYGLASSSSSSECRGIHYVEFDCPENTAEKIAKFYETVFDATTSTMSVPPRDDIVANDENDEEEEGGRGAYDKVAVIGFGDIDSDGRSDQSLVFRETSEPLPEYDGHHIAMYVGANGEDFDVAFRNADAAGVVWVNPRFTDDATTLEGANRWKQFRFKDIIDFDTGAVIMELEHEMRSVDHDAFPGRGGG